MMTRIFAACGLALLFPVVAVADTLWYSSGNTQPLPTANIKILSVTDTEVSYETRGGQTSSRPLAGLKQFAIDGEDAFNAAEEAFVKGQFDKSIDGYARTARSTQKEWLREWSSRRLIIAANESQRFDAATTAYLSLLLRNPELAAKHKPALPDAKSAYLQTAAGEINTLLQGRLTEAQQLSLLNFLLEIQRQRDDKTAVNETLARIQKFGANAGDNPAVVQALLDSRLTQANLQLDAKNYKTAADLIEKQRAAFVEPQQQAEALFILAAAKQGLAKPDDKDAQLDAAMAYMRVVAHFSEIDGRPRVGDALMAVAAIHERIGDAPTARDLYAQIASEFADTPIGVAAKKEAARLAQ